MTSTRNSNAPDLSDAFCVPCEVPGPPIGDHRPDQTQGQDEAQSERDALERLRTRASRALDSGRFDLTDELMDGVAGHEVELAQLVENLRIYQAELQIQNEELQDSQRQSQDALARFSTFFNNLPLAGLVIDRQGLIKEANQRARTLFGLSDRLGNRQFFARLIKESRRGEVIHAWSHLSGEQTREFLEVGFQSQDRAAFIGDLHLCKLPERLGEAPCYICVVIDRTEAVRQRRALADTTERLRESQEGYRVLAQFSTDWDYWLGPDGRYRYVSPACERLTGYPAEAFLDDPELLARLIHPDDLERWQHHLDETLADDVEDIDTLEFRLLAADGQTHWIEHLCRPVKSEDGRFLGRRGANRDITERKRIAKAMERSEHFLNATGEIAKVGGWEMDVATEVVRWTDMTYRIHDLSPSDAPPLGKALDFFHPADRKRLKHRLDRAVKHGEPYDLQLRMTTAKGREIWVQTTCQPLLEADRVTKLQGTIQDISHLKRSEVQLEFLAHHDPLTGLANRSLFRARLEQCLQRAGRKGTHVGLLFLDLDRFKYVNDSLGHSVGDQLLEQVAAALATQVRTSDTIARLGGDEFVLIMDDFVNPRLAAKFARRLLSVLNQPFQTETRELHITASIGISIFPEDGSDMETLLRHADIAMYRAKESGRNCFNFYESSMSIGAAERLRLEQELRGALARNEMTLHYQPQVAFSDGSLRGVEALCRWEHPRLGLVAPDLFIPVAEDSGLIGDLSAWVLEQACQQLIAWDAAGLRVPRVAVNLPMREIERIDLVNRVKRTLERTGLAPDRLELEVTESMIMRRLEIAIATLGALRELGVVLALDDFGTGHSSLTSLKQLPLNRLKMDKSFVDKLGTNPEDDAIARAVIALGRSLGLGVIAEGIETRTQHDFLHDEYCDEGQGYLYGRPLAADAFLEAWSLTQGRG